MMTKSAAELHQAAGQILIGGFPGEQIHQDFAALVSESRVGGAILFARNLTTLEACAGLVESLRALTAPAPLWLAIDQEGGRVQRLRAPFPELPPMRAFGEHRKKTLVQRAAHLIGESLSLFGFNQNYAPVLDVDSNPDNPVIGDRSFSRDPSLVARLGAAYVDGLQSAGVAACGKHFPGHGDTSEDSHLALPTLPHDLERLEALELIPFRSAVRAEVATIMTAHILFPALDREHPATLSPHVIDALLRRSLGFDGVVVSDDLEMKAIADHYGVADAAVRAVRAGCDQLLVCHQPSLVREAHQALVSAVERGTLERGRLLEAAARVRALKERFPVRGDRPPPSEVVAALPAAEHAAVLAELAGAAQVEPPSFGGPTGGNDRIVEWDFDGDPDEVLELDVPKG